MGPPGTTAVARATERLRDRWVKDRLIERGRVHANSMGFSDIYSFTKAMAEHAVVELHGDIPLSIVRPSIIESALAEPFAGWLEGFRMAEPLILAFGRNILRDFSGLPDSLLDVIPADFVVNTVLAVAANPPPDAKPRVYHAASGSRNPLRFRRIVDEARTYFTEHPLRDRYGQAIGTPSWTYPTRQEMATRARTALRVVEAAQWFVERLPLGASIAEMSDDLNAERERLERGVNLIQLYGVYTEVDCIFDTRNVTALWEKTPAAERKTFPFDPALYDWTHYFQDVHFPTVVRMSRAETAARRGQQPSGSTAPKAEASSVRSAIERRAGRGDVLAVFDVDGTLVETNVVEYFLWMRFPTCRCSSLSARRSPSTPTRACPRSPASVAGGSNGGGWRRATGACRCPIRAPPNTGKQSGDEIRKLDLPICWGGRRTLPHSWGSTDRRSGMGPPGGGVVASDHLRPLNPRLRGRQGRGWPARRRDQRAVDAQAWRRARAHAAGARLASRDAEPCRHLRFRPGGDQRPHLALSRPADELPVRART